MTSAPLPWILFSFSGFVRSEGPAGKQVTTSAGCNHTGYSFSWVKRGLCTHRPPVCFFVTYELIAGPTASVSVRFLPPRWELLFQRGEFGRILILGCQEVKWKVRSSL